MDEIIAWLPKITNEKFATLMQVLLDENIIGCNIYELLICRYCMSKQIIFLLLMLHIFYSTSTTKFEFVKRQYLHESIQTLKKLEIQKFIKVFWKTFTCHWLP
jgi:hypothetical protein